MSVEDRAAKADVAGPVGAWGVVHEAVRVQRVVLRRAHGPLHADVLRMGLEVCGGGLDPGGSRLGVVVGEQHHTAARRGKPCVARAGGTPAITADDLCALDPGDRIRSERWGAAIIDHDELPRPRRILGRECGDRPAQRCVAVTGRDHDADERLGGGHWDRKI